MNSKVILILVDGMRPDGIMECCNPYLANLRDVSTHCFKTMTVMPSVTLPCHASLFLSVDPERHGITTNTWMPLVRPIESIGDIVSKFGKKAAMFSNWEQLRDLSRPGALHTSYYECIEGDQASMLVKEQKMTDAAISYIQKELPDFLFLYLGNTDIAGHDYGWMTEPYFTSVSNASACIEKVINSVPEGYDVIITADHGGHDRGHGTNSDDDMLIPLICHGPSFEKGKALDQANIKDIAPTITHILGLPAAPEWEGKLLV